MAFCFSLITSLQCNRLSTTFTSSYGQQKLYSTAERTGEAARGSAEGALFEGVHLLFDGQRYGKGDKG